MRGSTCKGEGGGGGHAPNPWKTPSSLAKVLRYTDSTIVVEEDQRFGKQRWRENSKLLKHSLITEN